MYVFLFVRLFVGWINLGIVDATYLKTWKNRRSDASLEARSWPNHGFSLDPVFNCRLNWQQSLNQNFLIGLIPIPLGVSV